MTAPPSDPPPTRDPQGFTEFYAANVDAVVAFAATRSPSAQDLADLVAATFLRAFESADTFDSNRGTPRAWVLGVCANVQRNWFRESARQRSLLERLRSEVPTSDDDLDRFDDILVAARRQPELVRVLASLEPGQRSVLRMVAIDGFSTRECAERLGISHGATRVRLMRARRSARRELDGAEACRPGSAENEGGRNS